MSDRRARIPHHNYCVRILFQETDKTLSMVLERDDTEGGVRNISTRTWDTLLWFELFAPVVLSWCANQVDTEPDELAEKIMKELKELDRQGPPFIFHDDG